MQVSLRVPKVFIYECKRKQKMAQYVVQETCQNYQEMRLFVKMSPVRHAMTKTDCQKQIIN